MGFADQNLSGFINIDKSEDWTSHDVVAKLRGLLKTRKIGHAGTLDPFATGVLPVAVGSCTRLLRFLTKSKEYQAEIDFSYLTDTDDLTGTDLRELGIDIDGEQWTREEFVEELANFVGDIEQIPPLYSAVKLHGKKLYELMRSGKNVILDDVKPKNVTVHEIKLVSFDYPKARVDIKCSEGTYIRAIARDLGGHLTMLRRTESNGFVEADAITIQELQERLEENPDFVDEILIAPTQVLKLPKFELERQESVDLQQGKMVYLDAVTGLEPGDQSFVQCVDEAQELIGIANLRRKNGAIAAQPKVIL